MIYCKCNQNSGGKNMFYEFLKEFNGEDKDAVSLEILNYLLNLGR